MKVTNEDLLKRIENPYQLAVIAGKRAVALAFGASPIIKTRARKQVSIALEEIEKGKVSIKQEKQQQED